MCHKWRRARRKKKRTNQQLAVFYDIPVNELERERISEEGLKPERLRSEKNNLILKVDLTRWQQQISFSSFFYVGMRQRKKARTRAWERQRELVLKFCVKIATVCTARHGTQLYLNMTNNNYARYKNNVCVRAFYVAKKKLSVTNFSMSKNERRKKNRTNKNFDKLSLWNWVIQK